MMPSLKSKIRSVKLAAKNESLIFLSHSFKRPKNKKALIDKVFCMVGLEGLEPPTNRLWADRSNQLKQRKRFYWSLSVRLTPSYSQINQIDFHLFYIVRAYLRAQYKIIIRICILPFYDFEKIKTVIRN